MSNDSITILKNDIEQQRINKKQLLAIQKKEIEGTEKVAKLSKLLEQATLDHEACVLSNLAGNASDHQLNESKANIKRLAESIQEASEPSEPMQKIKDKLLFEIFDLEGNIAAHRATLCRELAKGSHEEMMANKKLNEKLTAGYAAFLSNGEIDRSWTRFLLCNFPHPSEHDMQHAIEKFKSTNEFMRD